MKNQIFCFRKKQLIYENIYSVCVCPKTYSQTLKDFYINNSRQACLTLLETCFFKNYAYLTVLYNVIFLNLKKELDNTYSAFSVCLFPKVTDIRK